MLGTAARMTDECSARIVPVAPTHSPEDPMRKPQLRVAICATPLLAMAALAGCMPTATDPEPGDAQPPTVETVRFTDKASTPLAGAIDVAALDYVRATPELTTSADTDWRVRAAGRGKDGLNHVRLEQLHDGVLVWGGDIVVHASDVRIKSASGTIVTHLDGFATRATVSDLPRRCGSRRRPTPPTPRIRPPCWPTSA